MDRITRIHIKNVRAIEAVDLELSQPLTVLIGENGAGKSTILECLELLRKAAEPSFLQQLYHLHQNMPALLRRGAAELTLGVRIEDSERRVEPVDYTFCLRPRGAGAVVTYERLLVGPLISDQPRLSVLLREGNKVTIFHQQSGQVENISAEELSLDSLLVSTFGKRSPHRAIDRLLSALRGIEVHLRFDTLAAWAAQSIQRPETLRGTAMLAPADRLTLLGQNLANAWFALKNVDDAYWRDTMAIVRLGLGDAIDSVNTVPSSGGYISLAVKYTDLAEPIPATSLSDGQLSWLAFVALARLNPSRSLLAIDEPELHLHPALLGRVVTLLANLPNQPPVVLSTHSDRVLEMLDDPTGVRVCSLNGSRAEVSRIDPAELPRWLEQFGDLGQLRASGYLPRLLVPTPQPAAERAR